MLADVQIRLVFEVELYMRDAVFHFRPTADQLRYPMILQGTDIARWLTGYLSFLSLPVLCLPLLGGASMAEAARPLDVVFPPVANTLHILSCLYNRVEARIPSSCIGYADNLSVLNSGKERP